MNLKKFTQYTFTILLVLCGSMFSVFSQCDNGICDEGEDFSTCPNDCPCSPNSLFADITDLSASDVAIAYCASESDAIPDGSIGIPVATFGGVGDFSDFPYNFTTGIGTTTGPLLTDGSNVSIGYVLLTQAELDAGGIVIIIFTSTVNESCLGALSFNIADLNITDINTSCGVPVCGDGICNTGEDNSNCPGDCPAICGVFEGGPWTDLRNTSCFAGETTEAGFQAWSNEAYVLDVTAETQYTFSICDGFDPNTDGWNGGVVLSAYEDDDANGIVDDLNNPIATGTDCSLTFNAVQDGVILLVVNDANCTGNLVQSDNGFASITTDTNCGFSVCGNGICEEGEDSANCPGDCLCGNGICDLGENNDNCPGDCPAICGVFEGGPWTDLRNTSCFAGETIEAGFQAWSNEAYVLDVTAETQYTFSICDGFDPNVDGWNGGVVLSAYEDTDANGIVDDLNNPIATGTDCSLTFTAVQDGVIVLVVNDANCTGSLLANDNGFASITTDTNCELTVCGNGICEDGEDNANCPGDCLCGNGICDLGENNDNCPGDCPGVCGVFGAGPWSTLRNTSCFAGETVEAGFQAWANEAYYLDITAEVQYTFSICDGFDPNADGWNGGVVLSAYEDTNQDGIIDDINNPIATGTDCSLTFTPVQDGVMILVINDANCTGNLLQNDNGFLSITTDTDCIPSFNNEIFTAYPWLGDLIDPNNCQGTMVNVFDLGPYAFIQVIDDENATLYFQDGTFYCQDGIGLNCIQAYSLGNPTYTWTCNENPPLFATYPWLESVIDLNNCNGITVNEFDVGPYAFIQIVNNGNATLYFEDGSFYCQDGIDLNCLQAYGLSNPTDTWTCNNPNIPSMFDKYSWLNDLYSATDCNGSYESITEYDLGAYAFIYVQETDFGMLYFQDGSPYCNSENFDCLNIYGLTNPTDITVCSENADSENPERMPTEFISNWLVYPNPTSGSFTIDLNEQNENTSLISIYDIQGKVIEEVLLDNHQTVLKLNLEHLDNGMYFVALQKYGAKAEMKKLIIKK